MRLLEAQWGALHALDTLCHAEFMACPNLAKPCRNHAWKNCFLKFIWDRVLCLVCIYVSVSIYKPAKMFLVQIAELRF